MRPWIRSLWYENPNILRLTRRLQSDVSRSLTAKGAKVLTQHYGLPRDLAKDAYLTFLINIHQRIEEEVYGRIRPHLQEHLNYRYPFADTPDLSTMKTEDRLANMRYIEEMLRKNPRRIKLPADYHKVKTPIVLFGVDYTAESLVFSGGLQKKRLPDKNKLEYTRHDAGIDYALGVLSVGSDMLADFLDYLDDKRVQFPRTYSIPGHAVVETFGHELFIHRIPDLFNRETYSIAGQHNEHVWGEAWGRFPEILDKVSLDVLRKFSGKSERLYDEFFKDISTKELKSFVRSGHNG